MSEIPTQDEIAKLPRWARVAFAARCARRVLPFFVAGQSEGEYRVVGGQSEREYRVTQAVDLAESVAASGQVDHDETYAISHATQNVEKWVDLTHNKVPLAAVKSALAAIMTARTSHKWNGRHDRSFNVSCTHDAARYAADALQEFETRMPSTVSEAAILTPITEDFNELLKRAQGGRWTDDTSVAQDVFGPMWPSLFSADDRPKKLVETIKAISAKLVSYLKKHPEELRRIRPRQFEELIAEILPSYGWNVHITPSTRDGGYDLLAVTTNAAGTHNSWIIECKKWEHKVGVDVVRNLYGIRNTMQVGGAMIATTSHFSRDAYTYRDTKTSLYDLALKDYDGILEWINEYRPNPNGRLYIQDRRLIVPVRMTKPELGLEAMNLQRGIGSGP